MVLVSVTRVQLDGQQTRFQHHHLPQSMEFEAKSELVLVDDTKGGLVSHDAQFEERRLAGAAAAAKKDSRSLYEQIAEQRSAAEELKKAGASQAFKPRGLDEEEADFLDQQLETSRRREESNATQEEIDRRAFELAVAMRQAAAKGPVKRAAPAAVYKVGAAAGGAVPGAAVGSVLVAGGGGAGRGVTAASASPAPAVPGLAGQKRGRAEVASGGATDGAGGTPSHAGGDSSVGISAAGAAASSALSGPPSQVPGRVSQVAPTGGVAAPDLSRAPNAQTAPPRAGLVAYDSDEDDA